MAQHTPGPWNVAGDYRGWITVQDQHCNIVTFCQQKPNPETMRADLRLIAAAPDLLEALRMMVAARTRGFLEPWEHEERLDAAVAAARAAIARAEGE